MKQITKILCSWRHVKKLCWHDLSVSLNGNKRRRDRWEEMKNEGRREKEVKTAAVNDRFWHVLCCSNKHFFYKSRLGLVLVLLFFLSSLFFLLERGMGGGERESDCFLCLSIHLFWLV